ncbi:hypothetical protein, partial [Streptococcus pneumoniae]|uniref:hypothetical protein n=1 Tax=Streptococcus pneumoniae TaxID=1313 RepID=UPI0011BA533F
LPINATLINLPLPSILSINPDTQSLPRTLPVTLTFSMVAFIGNVTSVGTGGNFLTGIVGENWKGYVERAYVDAHIKGKRAKAAG